MSRMEKKCLLASTVMHGSLVLLLVFGSAFLTSPPKKQEFPRLRVVPHTLVDDALAGGGGNPNIPITDDVQKGDTMTPQPPAPAPAPAPTPAPPAPTPTPPTPQPTPVQPPPPAPTPKPIKPVVKQADPKPAPPKPEPAKIAKPLKPDLKATEKTPDLKDLLKPIVRTNDDKAKAKAEAEARETARVAAREAAEAARAEAAYQAKLAKAFGGATSTLREGFASGTKVDVGGPGGAAYADYLSYVDAIYRDAWDRTLPQDILADDSTSIVSVTIARNGRVINSKILRKSGDATIDRVVQKTLSRVTTIGHPFPAGAKDEERTFTIELNFRKRRVAG